MQNDIYIIHIVNNPFPHVVKVKDGKTMNKHDIAIYNKYGITVNGDKLVTPIKGIEIMPILKDNNSKLNGDKKTRKADPNDNGNKVYTFGTLPTDQEFNSKTIGRIKGTCPCTCTNCNGEIACYGMTGFYRYNIDGMAIRTALIRNFPEWTKNAIMAQLEIIGNDVDIRLHDTGDFDSVEYLNMWVDIIKAFPNNRFWTYTKHAEFESAFDQLPNANIVRSMIPNCGYNFGHIDYILNVYRYLVAIGETPYICRCGIDKNQHCYNCNECINNKYVLFIEHSTEYKAVDDPHYTLAVDVIEKQKTMSPDAIADYIGDMIQN